MRVAHLRRCWQLDKMIFAVREKTGRLIRLTNERWAHIIKHPEMANKIEQIKETLTHPTKITAFVFDSRVRFYYRYYKERNGYLFVSVKYLNGEGFIITSFYTDKIK